MGRRFIVPEFFSENQGDPNEEPSDPFEEYYHNSHLAKDTSPSQAPDLGPYLPPYFQVVTDELP
jgi:hypothetical protein